jgi:hypothetical protein
MKTLMILASIVSLGWISATEKSAIDACLADHGVATCHYTIIR